MKTHQIIFSNFAARQKGLTLLETLGSIILSVIIIGGAISLWKMASSGSLENAAANQIMAIQLGYRNWYSAQTTYTTSDITAVGITAGIFPSDLKVGTTTVTNGWAGGVLITGATSQFTISWAGVPQSSCTKLAVIKSDWQALTINTVAQTLPMTPAAAATACNAATNTLVYTSL